MSAPRHALVTGGSRGIGRAIAAALLGQGCTVMIAGRDPAALRAAEAELGGNLHGVAADLVTREGVALLARAVRDRFGALDILVNNAGATARGGLFDVPDQAWEEGFALKCFGGVRLARALWPLLVDAGGSVVNIAGVGGRTPAADFVLGAAVNAAIMAITKSLAEQGAADGVRVNCINPGLIETGRLRARAERVALRDGVDLDAAKRTLAAEWGVPRIGQPEEIAAMAVFLTLGGGTYCQGGIFDVDGGRTRGL